MNDKKLTVRRGKFHLRDVLFYFKTIKSLDLGKNLPYPVGMVQFCRYELALKLQFTSNVPK